jgi:plasmid stabilization system protein ParE
MVEVRVIERALSDIEAIGEFISRDSEKYGKLTVQGIFETIRYLTEFPEIGRVVPEANIKSIREVFYGNYRIIYFTISKKRIDVIAIHNSAQLLTKTHIKKRKK